MKQLFLLFFVGCLAGLCHSYSVSYASDLENLIISPTGAVSVNNILLDFDCQSLFVESTLSLLGDDPSCFWNTTTTIVVKLGQNPSLYSDSSVILTFNSTFIASEANSATLEPPERADVDVIVKCQSVFRASYAFRCTSVLMGASGLEDFSSIKWIVDYVGNETGVVAAISKLAINSHIANMQTYELDIGLKGPMNNYLIEHALPHVMNVTFTNKFGHSFMGSANFTVWNLGEPLNYTLTGLPFSMYILTPNMTITPDQMVTISVVDDDIRLIDGNFDDFQLTYERGWTVISENTTFAKKLDLSQKTLTIEPFSFMENTENTFIYCVSVSLARVSNPSVTIMAQEQCENMTVTVNSTRPIVIHDSGDFMYGSSYYPMELSFHAELRSLNPALFHPEDLADPTTEAWSCSGMFEFDETQHFVVESDRNFCMWDRAAFGNDFPEGTPLVDKSSFDSAIQPESLNEQRAYEFIYRGTAYYNAQEDRPGSYSHVYVYTGSYEAPRTRFVFLNNNDAAYYRYKWVYTTTNAGSVENDNWGPKRVTKDGSTFVEWQPVNSNDELQIRYLRPDRKLSFFCYNEDPAFSNITLSIFRGNVHDKDIMPQSFVDEHTSATTEGSFTRFVIEPFSLENNQQYIVRCTAQNPDTAIFSFAEHRFITGDRVYGGHFTVEPVKGQAMLETFSLTAHGFALMDEEDYPVNVRFGYLAPSDQRPIYLDAQFNIDFLVNCSLPTDSNFNETAISVFVEALHPTSGVVHRKYFTVTTAKLNETGSLSKTTYLNFVPAGEEIPPNTLQAKLNSAVKADSLAELILVATNFFETFSSDTTITSGLRALNDEATYCTTSVEALITENRFGAVLYNEMLSGLLTLYRQSRLSNEGLSTANFKASLDLFARLSEYPYGLTAENLRLTFTELAASTALISNQAIDAEELDEVIVDILSAFTNVMQGSRYCSAFETAYHRSQGDAVVSAVQYILQQRIIHSATCGPGISKLKATGFSLGTALLSKSAFVGSTVTLSPVNSYSGLQFNLTEEAWGEMESGGYFWRDWYPPTSAQKEKIEAGEKTNYPFLTTDTECYLGIGLVSWSFNPRWYLTRDYQANLTARIGQLEFFRMDAPYENIDSLINLNSTKFELTLKTDNDVRDSLGGLDEWCRVWDNGLVKWTRNEAKNGEGNDYERDPNNPNDPGLQYFNCLYEVPGMYGPFMYNEGYRGLPDSLLVMMILLPVVMFLAVSCAVMLHQAETSNKDFEQKASFF